MTFRVTSLTLASKSDASTEPRRVTSTECAAVSTGRQGARHAGSATHHGRMAMKVCQLGSGRSEELTARKAGRKAVAETAPENERESVDWSLQQQVLV
ncbi:unnamed protein product [Lampetra planeri]